MSYPNPWILLNGLMLMQPWILRHLLLLPRPLLASSSPSNYNYCRRQNNISLAIPPPRRSSSSSSSSSACPSFSRCSCKPRCCVSSGACCCPISEKRRFSSRDWIRSLSSSFSSKAPISSPTYLNNNYNLLLPSSSILLLSSSSSPPHILLTRRHFASSSPAALSSTSANMATEYKLKDIQSLASIPNFEKVESEVEGLENGKVLVVRVNDDFHALSPRCTHYGAPLKLGTVSPDGRITCPWHGGNSPLNNYTYITEATANVLQRVSVSPLEMSRMPPPRMR